MAKKAAKVTLDDIRAGLRQAGLDFLKAVAKAQPRETIYGFLFEISAEGFSAHGAVATEEALARHIADQADGDPDEAARLRKEYRWAGPEDGWYQRPDKPFDAVNRLLSAAATSGLYEEYDGTLVNVCLDVLKDLDGSGTFGDAEARNRVVLGICYIGGDNSTEEFLAWAKQVNPPDVMRRLRKELKERGY